jgi:hypothetical protein
LICAVDVNESFQSFAGSRESERRRSIQFVEPATGVVSFVGVVGVLVHKRQRRTSVIERTRLDQSFDDASPRLGGSAVVGEE